MVITGYHNKHCFEFLPSIMLQECDGHYFLYLAWGTFSIEFSFNEDYNDEDIY